mmetsp:Transcript_22661/g.34057  ORF Transcript_22661/g.34057 Transcript_22661/m.34057 type:complete len:147 (-) Transcript_22661:816-1256(-)
MRLPSLSRFSNILRTMVVVAVIRSYAIVLPSPLKISGPLTPSVVIVYENLISVRPYLVGASDKVGEEDGATLGNLVGVSDGSNDGLKVGILLGKSVGAELGWKLGDIDGTPLGIIVGYIVGVSDWLVVGAALGALLGEGDGLNDGR